MKTAEVRHALRRRYAEGWVCLEEPFGIDFFALCTRGQYASSSSHPWVAHEIKVSRGDMRGELKKPSKRAYALTLSHQFFFVVPMGLLTKEEIAWEEPEDLDHTHFKREPCPEGCYREPGGQVTGRYDHDAMEFKECRVCDGRGYLKKSWIEEYAPTLWIPKECGLIEVMKRGTRVVKAAPHRKPERVDHFRSALLVQYAQNPGAERNIEIRKAQARWKKEEAELAAKTARQEVARAQAILADRLPAPTVGSSWAGRRASWREPEKVVVSCVEDGIVRFESPLWSGSRRQPIGEFLMEFEPAERAGKIAA